MGKTGKWLSSFLGSGKKDKDRKDKEKETQSLGLVQCQSVSSSSTSQTPKEKRRWSFRRSVHKDSSSRDSVSTAVDATTTNSVSIQHFAENEEGQRKHAIAVSAATASPADAAIAAGIRLTSNPHQPIPAEEIAALKIQSAFRCHLAKKALRALKGLVKLQALVRGHLVRKQAAATLRCMQALVTVQARARAQRIMAVMAEESSPVSRRLSVHRRSLHEHHHPFRHSYDMGRDTDDNIKIVEMDIGESRGVSRGMMSNANRSDEQMFSVNRRSLPPLPKLDRGQSPTPWTEITEISPKACNPHFDGFSFGTTQISPPRFSAMSRPYSSRGSSLGGGGHTIEYAESVCNDYSSFPSYMANTESSRAKARSQSAPKQRPDSYERTPSRRRATMEKRSVPSGYRMQRSSSQVGSTCKGYHYQCPATLKLDRSAISLKDSECGSTCSVLTNTDYCRSLVAIEAFGTPGTNSPFHVPSRTIECLNEACDYPGK